MNTKETLKYLFFFFMITCFIACKKETEWLDKKSSKQNVIPQTLQDYQALLDDNGTFNQYYSFNGNAGTDNYFVKDEDLGTLNEFVVNIYKWDSQINWRNGSASAWNLPFQVIAYANLVLEGMKEINPDQQGYNNVLGQAYFYRAYAYLNLSQNFCKAYNPKTSKSDLGLPIRLSSDVDELQQRSNVEDLYLQIISDAEKSLEYLDEVPRYMRASKPAANALLSKIYFLMGNFEKALQYADETLKSKSELTDFNTSSIISHSYAYKFKEFGKDNPEIIFYTKSPNDQFERNFKGDVVQANRSLFDLYDENDLRKEYFFEDDNQSNLLNFVGSYTGTFSSFGGLAVNEILLIRAECLARQNNLNEALTDLNKLLSHRYRIDTFIPIETNNQKELIKIILQERRKELANVGNTRWEDLKRLNLDNEYQTTLQRTVNGQTLNLLPNDSKYLLSIPINEINFSKIEQNIRE